MVVPERQTRRSDISQSPGVKAIMTNLKARVCEVWSKIEILRRLRVRVWRAREQREERPRDVDGICASKENICAKMELRSAMIDIPTVNSAGLAHLIA